MDDLRPTSEQNQEPGSDSSDILSISNFGLDLGFSRGVIGLTDNVPRHAIHAFYLTV